MRKLFWQISTTLDGYMEAPGGSLELTAEIQDKEFESYGTEMLDSIDSFILGRRTYELFVGHWPTATGRDADILNRLPKYVVSTTLETVDWNNGQLVNGDIETAIGDLKKGDGRDIAVFGSSTLAASLLEMGMIDECRIMITPYLLGRGHHALKPFETSRALSLTKCEKWSSGTVYLTYAVRPTWQ